MSGHLEILQAIFPKQLLLDVDDIAHCMKVSAGHIHNLVSAKTFPLPLERGLGRRTMVSILSLAKYLDDTLLPPVPAPKEVLPTKKKPGRPRGSGLGRFDIQQFQTSLAAAVYKVAGNEALDDALEFVDGMTFSEEMDERCVKEFLEIKIILEAQIKALRGRFINLTTTIKAPDFDPDIRAMKEVT